MNLSFELYGKPGMLDLGQTMVNSSIMNIDVREYLRINPISVHELTLSEAERDCFLYLTPIDESS